MHKIYSILVLNFHLLLLHFRIFIILLHNKEKLLFQGLTESNFVLASSSTVYVSFFVFNVKTLYVNSKLQKPKTDKHIFAIT